MKRSFVAMALIMVLCLSQFLIGNAAGKALDITDTIVVNEGDAANNAYELEKTDAGVVVKGTSTKGEWACLKGAIDGNAKEYAKLVLKVEGKAGTTLKLKLEGGVDSAVIESGWEHANFNDPVLVDGEQTIEWTLDPAWLTSDGGQSLVIFINPGKAGATDEVTFKSVKLVTADYVEPEIDDTADINVAPLYAVLVLGVAVVAFASKKRFAR
ncbi:MAG: hypothetical protein IJA58_01465 [Lachnospiraceae bacterium]|nr:hypothetical protein [Lachnospiraceae bacterium]